MILISSRPVLSALVCTFGLSAFAAPALAQCNPSDPVFEVSFFTRTLDASASSPAGNDSDVDQSTTFETDTDDAIVEISGAGDEMCDCSGGGYSAERMEVIAPDPGPVMVATIDTDSGCPDDTVCPANANAQTFSDPAAGANANSNGSTSFSIRLELLRTADLSVEFDWFLLAVNGGSFTSANSSASYSASVSDGTLQQLYTNGAEVGVVGTGSDMEDGMDTFTLMNASPGTYFIGASLMNQAGVILSDPDLSATANTNTASFTRITATAVDCQSSTTTSTLPQTPSCGDPLPDGSLVSAPEDAGIIAASDALFILQAAVGGATCELCVCDIDGSGAITATDALVALNAAVGLEVTLNCPPCP